MSLGKKKIYLIKIQIFILLSLVTIFSEKDYINESTNLYKLKSNFINFSKEEFKNSINPMIWSLESPSNLVL